MTGQLSIFDYKPVDMTSDRKGKSRPAPNWMHRERCENCERWAKYSFKDQPPDGWGTYGFCNEHKQRVLSTSYCMNFDDKTVIKEG